MSYFELLFSVIKFKNVHKHLTNIPGNHIHFYGRAIERNVQFIQPFKLNLSQFLKHIYGETSNIPKRSKRMA